MKNPGLTYSQVFTGFLPFFKLQSNTHILKIRQKKPQTFTSTSDIHPYTPLSAIFLDLLPVLSTSNPCIRTSALSPPFVHGGIHGETHCALAPYTFSFLQLRQGEKVRSGAWREPWRTDLEDDWAIHVSSIAALCMHTPGPGR